MTLEKITPGEGIMGTGFYTIITAYLAKPSFKIPCDKKHQLVITLMDFVVYVLSEPLKMEYSLLLAR